VQELSEGNCKNSERQSEGDEVGCVETHQHSQPQSRVLSSRQPLLGTMVYSSVVVFVLCRRGRSSCVGYVEKGGEEAKGAGQGKDFLRTCHGLYCSRKRIRNLTRIF